MVKFEGKGASRTIIVSIVILSLLLSVLVVYFFSESKATIEDTAVQDTNNTASIAATNLAASLTNKLEQISNNLYLLSNSPAVLDANATLAQGLMTSAEQTTSTITMSYNLISPNGMIIASSAPADPTRSAANLSQRSYFSDAVKVWPATYINSNYIGVLDHENYVLFARAVYQNATVNATTTRTFTGVLVTAVDFTALGQLIRGELASSAQSRVSVVDYNGTILYAGSNSSNAGKNMFSPTVQQQLPAAERQGYDAFLESSLSGQQVLTDLTSGGASTAIASQPITFGEVLGNASDQRLFASLYVVSPSLLAAAQIAQINDIQTFSALLILGITGSAACSSIVIVNRNRTLSQLVKERTKLLEEKTAELEDANKKLVSYADAQKEFINVAAHEIRTPLQPIFTVMELMVDSVNKEQAGQGSETIRISRDEAEMLERGVKRLDDITRNLLDLTRIDAGRFTLHKERFELNRMVEEDVQFLGRRSKPSTDLDIAFVPADEQLLVDVDRMRIFEVISNLVGNALKASKNTGNSRVEIFCTRAGKDAIVRVRDYGSGLTPEAASKLFTKFGTNSDSGLGLGLYISKKIVEGHGGSIWTANNDDGKGGTSFYFSLPLSHD